MIYDVELVGKRRRHRMTSPECRSLPVCLFSLALVRYPAHVAIIIQFLKLLLKQYNVGEIQNRSTYSIKILIDCSEVVIRWIS